MSSIADLGLNMRAAQVLRKAEDEADSLSVRDTGVGGEGRVYDFGVETHGSLGAGLMLARICMADLADISIHPADRSLVDCPLVQVRTDEPMAACLASQYAGWPVQVGKYFAMGSGPMRIRRGREQVLMDVDAADPDTDVAVGVLESDRLPDNEIFDAIAAECSVDPDTLYLAVAPTRSIAGTLQIVARSVETAMHQLHSRGGNLQGVRSAVGTAPLPPPAKEFVAALGRTNDAILYGGSVTLWVDDPSILDLVDQLVSSAASDWGRPFAEIFKAYDHDFYKVDSGLFAPARITVVDLKSGRCRTAGEFRGDCLTGWFDRA